MPACHQVNTGKWVFKDDYWIAMDFYLWDLTLGHVGKSMENDCWPLKVHNSQRFSNPPPQTTREPVVDVSCCPLVIKHRWQLRRCYTYTQIGRWHTERTCPSGNGEILD